MLRVIHQKLRLCAISVMLGTAFVLTNEKKITFKNIVHMENIDQKAEKIGLDRGYYLLLMAILDIPVDNEEHNIEAV
jgi:hypothetical protein